MADNETRVMVVDDARDAVETLVELLQLNGYVTSSASDGQQAMAAIEAFKPHCVLLDIRMPRLNGLELAKRLRELYGDDIVLVAITGGSGDDDQVAAAFQLVDHYLTKPIDIARFEKILPRLDG